MIERGKIFENISERNSTQRGYLSHSWRKDAVGQGVAIRNLSLLWHCNKGKFLMPEPSQHHFDVPLVITCQWCCRTARLRLHRSFLPRGFFYIFRQIGIEHETARRQVSTMKDDFASFLLRRSRSLAVRSFPRTNHELCFARRSFSHFPLLNPFYSCLCLTRVFDGQTRARSAIFAR